MIQFEIIVECPNLEKVSKLLRFEQNMVYLTDTELYSLVNLEQLSQTSSRFLKKLSKMLALIHDHIQQCPYCLKKGGKHCSLCNDLEPIFEYNISETKKCQECKRLFHKSCFKATNGQIGCPLCSRE